MHGMPSSRQSRNHPRTSMVPLGTGPWLDDTRDTRACQWTVGIGVVLFLTISGLVLARGPNPLSTASDMLLMFFMGVSCLMIVFGTAWFVFYWLLRRRIQTCPKCFGGMTLGATRCPHCHFDPAKESV